MKWPETLHNSRKITWQKKLHLEFDSESSSRYLLHHLFGECLNPVRVSGEAALCINAITTCVCNQEVSRFFGWRLENRKFLTVERILCRTQEITEA